MREVKCSEADTSCTLLKRKPVGVIDFLMHDEEIMDIDSHGTTASTSSESNDV